MWQTCVGCCGAVRALGKSSRLFISVYVFGRPHEEVGFANLQVQRFAALWVTQVGAQFSKRTHVGVPCDSHAGHKKEASDEILVS